MVSIPTMLAATALAAVGAPVLAPLAVVWDLARLKVKLPTLRLYGFVLQYLLNDSVEILLAPVLWVAAGFGHRLAGTASIARHERLQKWSLRLLTERADRLLGLRVEIDEQSRKALVGGPVIVVSRHASVFDASLAGVLYEGEDMAVRGVVMAEMLADPGFDLIYGRLGSVFVRRDDGEAARVGVSRMTANAADNTAYVIFPEGRLSGTSVRDRALEKLAQTSPGRHERLESLTHLLPPRPGGFLALLEALPHADVIVLGHEGFAAYPALKDLARSVPLEEPIPVTVQRICRAEIPQDVEQQIVWLDELWLALDANQGLSTVAPEG